MAEDGITQQISNWITGYWVSQAIYVAAKLGLADELAVGPRTVDELAAQTGTDPDVLFRLLRALASKGIFAERADGRFEMTALAEPLREDAPGSKRYMALMMGEEHYFAWGELLHNVRTGGTAFERVYGTPIFEFLAEHPDKAAIFDRAMGGVHGTETDDLLDAYDLSDVGTLADVGGGNGNVLRAALKRHPAMRGILFDLPNVVERAAKAFEGNGLAERSELIPSDFFEAVPEGADAYLLRYIIHDWDDDRSRRILRNVWDAMPDDARLLVAESVIPPGNEPFFGKWLDLTMLTIPGGRERTKAEDRALYESAGFELTQLVPTRREISIVEGRKV